MNQIVYFSTQEVIDFHDLLVELYGGSPGLRDRGLLESAVSQPVQEVFGNKRTGVHATITFLRLNGIKITKNFDDLYNFAIDVAASKIEFIEIVEYLKKHAIKDE